MSRLRYTISIVMEVIIIRKVELSMIEQKKYEVIKHLADHPDANKQRAAITLGCSLRHINRMLNGYREHGKQFFIHGNKGRKPVNAISAETRELIADLYRTKYYDSNFTHFTELLGKYEGIHVSASTVASVLETACLFSPKMKKAKKKRIKKQLYDMKAAAKTQKEITVIQKNIVAVEDAHSRRPRKAYFGELIQMDASSYKWISGQVWHLHLAIDDATGCIVGGYFDYQETLNGYYNVFHQILKSYGIPYKFFTDCRTVFIYRHKNDSNIENDTYTQFAYSCRQFGVELDSSSVPQAKGRIERLNETLQSRLPVELRLAGVTTIDAANEFLTHYIKEFNEKFALPVNSIKSVFEEQPSDEKINLTLAVLCSRTVDAGHNIRYSNRYYRMVDENGNQVHYKEGTKVMFIKSFNGELYCSVNDSLVFALEEIPDHEVKSENFDPDYTPAKPEKHYIPSMNHPWKRQSFNSFIKSQKHHRNDTLEKF